MVWGLEAGLGDQGGGWVGEEPGRRQVTWERKAGAGFRWGSPLAVGDGCLPCGRRFTCMSSFALPSDPINVGIGLFLLSMEDANRKDEAICLLPVQPGGP